MQSVSGFGQLRDASTSPCSVQNCTTDTLCSNIPSGDPYRTTSGNECTGPDGSIYVFDANGNLTARPWYSSPLGMIGIGVGAAAVLFFIFPRGGAEHGDGMHGARRRRRR